MSVFAENSGRARPAIVPRAALAAAAALALLVTGLAAWKPRAAVALPPAQLIRERALRVADCTGGGVQITDAATGRLVLTAQGQLGFLRQTLRGLALNRQAQGGARGAPFLLSYYADRRLILRDSVAGRQVELEAFGPSNEAVFARLLGAEGGAPPPCGPLAAAEN